VNAASREDLLRVPGFGVKTVDRIIEARRHRAIRAADLGRLRVPLKTALPFIVLPDHRPTHLIDRADLHVLVKQKPPLQLSLFDNVA
jgi:predicted DNA-binding helix-hairpin-helix protein